MVTFSVNSGIDSKDKVKKVAELIKQANKYNSEYMGEAFIKIAEGFSGSVNLNDFAEKQKAAENRILSDTLKFLSEEESGLGFEGVQEVIDATDYAQESTRRIDVDYYAEKFLTLREKLYFKEGADIWRLLKLVCLGDAIAGPKLKRLIYEYNETEFLYEFCSDMRHIYAVKKYLGW